MLNGITISMIIAKAMAITIIPIVSFMDFRKINIPNSSIRRLSHELISI